VAQEPPARACEGIRSRNDGGVESTATTISCANFPQSTSIRRVVPLRFHRSLRHEVYIGPSEDESEAGEEERRVDVRTYPTFAISSI